MNQEDKLSAEYRQNGFCKITAFFSASEVQDLIGHIDAFIAVKSRELSGRDINFSGAQVNSIHCLATQDPYFSAILNTPRVMAVASRFLGEDASPRAAELFAKPAHVGLPSPMHQDNYYWCIKGGRGLTIWTALDYCDSSNGGVTYYAGSHKMGIVEHRDSNAPGSSQMIADGDLLKKLSHTLVCPSLKPGDILVHHSEIIHGSAENSSARSRRGFTMQFRGAASEYDPDMRAHYEARLAAQIRNRTNSPSH